VRRGGGVYSEDVMVGGGGRGGVGEEAAQDAVVLKQSGAGNWRMMNGDQHDAHF
jgi:hypothetical protein